jgi:asparagine synthase (glutamine-hydrolysing)
MCGVSGILLAGGGGKERLIADVGAMTDALSHRGPDDDGLWVDEAAGIALGHRRLAILDLSPFGHQPMLSRSGRFVLCYNGEIYNFRELKGALEQAGCRFRGQGDTEVLTEAFEAWGVRPTLQRLDGMYAIALWDRQDRELVLARDPMGEKPLYYSWAGPHFLFGSELKALRRHPAFEGRVDSAALTLLMRHSYIPGPHTIYEGVFKLPPGCLLRVHASRGTVRPEPTPFWSLAAAVEAGRARPFEGDDREAADRLDDLLRRAVRLRMESDVPLGAFLSGGVDSSTIVAMMQSQSPRPVRTFTIGMTDSELDESEAARKVAAHLGTDHVETLLTAGDALDLVPSLPEMYDEPFADISQLPTALMARVARQHVTVCLSGDGGDEVFGGYNRYVAGDLAWRRSNRMPLMLRRAAAQALLAASPATWDRVVGAVRRTGMNDVPAAGAKVHKLANLLKARDEREAYLRLVSHWYEPTEVVQRAVEPSTYATDPAWWSGDTDWLPRMLLLDGLTTLPDDMFVKLDRATMSVALEARVPLVSPAVVEFAWTLPIHLKVRDGQGKWLLRQVLDRYVPRSLIDRPKLGFDPPVGAWLRGPLREWAESLLDEKRLRGEGLFRSEPIAARWREHLDGRRDHTYALWSVLMVQAWLDRVTTQVVA